MRTKSVRLAVVSVFAVLSVFSITGGTADAKTAHHQVSRNVCCAD